MEMTHTTPTTQAVALDRRQIFCIHVRMTRFLAMATIQGWGSFHPKLLIVQLLFKGCVYSKKYSNQLVFRQHFKDICSVPQFMLPGQIYPQIRTSCYFSCV